MQRLIVTFLGKIETRDSILRHGTLIEVAAVHTTLRKILLKDLFIFLR